MSKRKTRHPGVPEFLNADLDALAMAVGQRVKTIKHKCSGIQCTKEKENDGGERLNIDVDLRETSLRISAWGSGELWLRVCSGSGKNGWDFMYAAHGSWQGMGPDEFKYSVEATILPAFYAADAEHNTIGLIEECWPKARLIRER